MAFRTTAAPGSDRSDRERRRPVSTVVRALVFLAAAGLLLAAVAAEFGDRWWVADLFSHFRFHYLVGIVVIAVVGLVLRHRAALVMLSVAAALNGSALLHDYRALPAALGPSGGTPIRVVTVNVEWSNHTPEKALRFIRDSRADVVLIQEAEPRWHGLIETLRSVYPNIAPADWRREPQNILLSKRPIAASEVKIVDRVFPRFSYLVADVGIGLQSVRIVAVHPPYPLSARLTALQDRQLIAYAREAQIYPGPVLVAGDFNLTPWSPRFRQLLRDGGLRTADHGLDWPVTFPARSRFQALTSLPAGIAIDHVLVSRHFQVVRVARGSTIGSDHFPVTVDLSLQGPTIAAHTAK